MFLNHNSNTFLWVNHNLKLSIDLLFYIVDFYLIFHFLLYPYSPCTISRTDLYNIEKHASAILKVSSFSSPRKFSANWRIREFHLSIDVWLSWSMSCQFRSCNQTCRYVLLEAVEDLIYLGSQKINTHLNYCCYFLVL